MKVLIIVLAIILLFPLESFCGEVVSSGVEIKNGIYHINIQIRVNVGKEKVMGIFNDVEKLKTLSIHIKEINVVEKNDNGEIKKIKNAKLCFFLCMNAIQNSVEEIGDKVIEIVVPDQNNFNPSMMYLEISADEGSQTIISCKIEAKPKLITKALLSVISKRMIEDKLVKAGEKVIVKIESLVADIKVAGSLAENK